MPNWKYIWYDIQQWWARMLSRGFRFGVFGQDKYLRYKLHERWERLGIRNWINKNPKIVIGVCVAAVFIFLVIVIAQLMPYSPPIISQTSKAWFYDLNTDKLFITDGDRIPPIQAPSGKLPDGQPGGVKAYVFSYSRDPSESERFIGYLEKYTPEGKKIVSSFRKSGDKVTEELIEQLNNNRFVRRLDDDHWFLVDSSEGRVILEQVSFINEMGQMPYYCPPK